MALLTLALVKKHLRLDPDDTSEDDLLSLHMETVEEHIVDYTGAPIPDPPGARRKSAALLYVSDLYENRGANMELKAQLVANPAAEMLLFPLRVNLGI